MMPLSTIAFASPVGAWPRICSVVETDGEVEAVLELLALLPQALASSMIAKANPTMGIAVLVFLPYVMTCLPKCEECGYHSSRRDRGEFCASTATSRQVVYDFGHRVILVS